MSWTWDASHFPHRVTAALESVWCRSAERGFASGARRYGLALAGWQVRADEGVVLVRNLEGIPRDEIGERERNAEAALSRRRWLADADRWRQSQRPRTLAAVQRLAACDLAALDNHAMAAHVGAVAALARRGVARHFELHLADMLPLGRLLVAARERGIPATDVVAMTAGMSPASGPSAAVAAHTAVGRLDVDAPTAGELGLDFGTGADAAGSREPPVPIAGFGDAVLDGLLEEVRATFWVRDDNATVLLAQPIGLLRLALREAGRRLDSAALEATPAEAASLLRGRRDPDKDELDARATARRRRLPAAEAVSPSPKPVSTDSWHGRDAVDAAGPTSRALTEALLAYDALYDATGAQGIGLASVRGEAVVADTPEQALARLEPGCVLVVRTTSPAFDPILRLVAGLVCEEGGVLSHAAVAARELGIPAVVALKDARHTIPDGAVVEVDAARGRVRVVPDR